MRSVRLGTGKRQVGGLSGMFITHHVQLRRVAMKILGTREQADDVVQDAYIKVMETASCQVEQPLAYLFQVVRNLAIDRYRSVALESRLFAAEEEGWTVPAGAGSPEALAGDLQQLNLVADALAKLPERTQRAFEMNRLGGQTQREVADQLGVSATLVNFMMRDALVSCRAAVGAA
ncbi:RNA polymerase factor sigma-70 [Massilia atriviolacea]|uniref:RNA polymerase factor sigma-70 n=1 Tax=Massilia atriviolacea TaxID=2495579 RepID=A0A430HSE1_9BURK|nr:RNA polymerase factor sigma-70 [Massilia atriviolacea]RSZ60389.1 RNA polymerase factor sigma-70 [Massilia atriviolacea]